MFLTQITYDFDKVEDINIVEKFKLYNSTIILVEEFYNNFPFLQL